MSTYPSDSTAPSREETDDRYAVLQVTDDSFVIYDTSNHEAWVQSDRTVERDERPH